MSDLKGAGKRFKARYGKKLRNKFIEVERKKKKLYKCPKCNRIKVKRVFAGVWQCKNCNTKFAGKAYSFN